MSRYVALVDGEPGGYGVVFPDCPGCTAMGFTTDEAILNAGLALAEWIDDARASNSVPNPRSMEEVRNDAEVRDALAEGAALVAVPAKHSGIRGVMNARNSQTTLSRRSYAVSIDAAGNAAYVRMSKAAVAETQELPDGILVDYDLSGDPVGIEILSLRERVGQADPKSYLQGLAEGLRMSRLQEAE